MNPIIASELLANLKAAIESERDNEAVNHEEALSDEYMEETSPLEMVQSAYKSGHEAATERLMPLLEKAVEMAEFYGDASTYDLKYRGVQVGPATIYGGTEIPTTEAFHEKGKKAREFLLSLKGDKS